MSYWFVKFIIMTIYNVTGVSLCSYLLGIYTKERHKRSWLFLVYLLFVFFSFFSLGAKIKGEKLKPINHSKAKAIPVPSSLSSLCRTTRREGGGDWRACAENITALETQLNKLMAFSSAFSLLALYLSVSFLLPTSFSSCSLHTCQVHTLFLFDLCHSLWSNATLTTGSRS